MIPFVAEMRAIRRLLVSLAIFAALACRLPGVQDQRVRRRRSSRSTPASARCRSTWRSRSRPRSKRAASCIRRAPGRRRRDAVRLRRAPASSVFWMKNTLIPLDMIFIGADRRIAGIVENAEPRDGDGARWSPAPSQYVLEIGGGLSARWASTPGEPVDSRRAHRQVAASRWRMQPMLATLADAPLRDPNLVYEPKYDGIRALIAVRCRADDAAEVDDRVARGERQDRAVPGGGGGADGLGRSARAAGAARRRDRGAGRRRGSRPASSGCRIASTSPPRARSRGARRRGPVAFVAFDLLRDGDEDLYRAAARRAARAGWRRRSTAALDGAAAAGPPGARATARR